MTLKHPQFFDIITIPKSDCVILSYIEEILKIVWHSQIELVSNISFLLESKRVNQFMEARWDDINFRCQSISLNQSF